MHNATYLDLDGVMADFHGAWCQLWGLSPTVSEEILSWDQGMLDPIEKHTGRSITMDDFWDKVEGAGTDWWANLDLLPWAQELYALCARFGPVVFMTAPAQRKDPMGQYRCITNCLPGKVEWIEKHFPDATRWAITPVKHHMSHPGAILVDDSPKGCQNFKEHGGGVYLFPRPWNSTDWRERSPLAELETLLVQRSKLP